MVHGLNLILENAKCNKIARQIQERKLLFPDNLAKMGRYVEHIRPIPAREPPRNGRCFRKIDWVIDLPASSVGGAWVQRESSPIPDRRRTQARIVLLNLKVISWAGP